MIQHSGGQVKLDLRVCTPSGINVNTDRIFCSTPHVCEYFLLYPRNVEPPRYSSRHKNVWVVGNPWTFFTNPHIHPLAPLPPSYRPGQFLPRCSHLQDKGAPDCLRSHSLSARFPGVFLCVCFKHSKESINSVSARSTFGLGKLIFSDRYANLLSLQLFTISFARLLHTPISLLCIARQMYRR